MSKDFIATATININAPVPRVWDALVNPTVIKQYMFGATVVSDWKEGSSIIWTGVWKDKPYVDKGSILTIEPEKVLRYSHFSPLSGEDDKPENYHVVTCTLSDEEDHTTLTLTQDNNANDIARDHSQKMWEAMLESLKKLLEL